MIGRFTLAPLPTWPDLFGALAGAIPDDAALSAPWLRPGEQGVCLSRSAWALRLVVDIRKEMVGSRRVQVWLPDYFCNDALAPLRRSEAQLLFFPVGADLEPDFRRCAELAKEVQPDLFVIVHYFGRPASGSREAAAFCRRTGAWLVEDAAHVLRPIRGVGESGEFALYSPHKHLPLPDGAVLVLRPESPGFAPHHRPHLVPTVHRLAAQMSASGACPTVSWWIKRAVQKLGFRPRRRSEFGDDGGERSLERGPAMSVLGRRLLARTADDLAQASRRRNRVVLAWQALVATDGDLVPAGFVRQPGACPYLAGFAAQDPQAAKRSFEVLSARHLPVTTWPDLPPEVRSDPLRHREAHLARQTRLYLHAPVTTSLPRIADLRTASAEEDGIEIAAFEGDHDEWHRWLCRVGPATLLQSWEYGMAKAKVEGWRIRRVYFRRGERRVAVAQLLERRRFGILRLIRLNRGPLFFPDASPAEIAGTVTRLAAIAGWWKAVVFSTAPELENTGSNLLQLAAAGFHFTRHKTASTIWIDLRRDLLEIRKSLDGKWRNMLNAAERGGLSLEASTADEAFEWMLVRYRETMEEKRFSGIPADVLRELRALAPSGRRPIVFRAIRGGEAVTGICVVPHGLAATYLVGWSGADGRAAKGSHFALWGAIGWLKAAGFGWFDLGGIDEEDLPGVADFKLGLNGRVIESAGEFWKF